MDRSKKKKDTKSSATLQHKQPSGGEDLPDFISAPRQRLEGTDEVERLKRELDSQKQKMKELEDSIQEERTNHERLLQSLRENGLVSSGNQLTEPIDICDFAQSKISNLLNKPKVCSEMSI